MNEEYTASRRRVLRAAGGAGIVALAGCTTDPRFDEDDPVGVEPRSPPEGPADTTTTLTAAPVASDSTDVDPTWVYDGAYPGPEIRATEGDVIEVTVENALPESTTVHWHGIPLANPMDGVPGVTQEPIPTDESFVYRYRAEPAGTYLYHSHVGLQLDRGLFGPLIIEEPSPHVEFDREYTVVFDDFLGTEPRPHSEGHTDDSTAGTSTGGMGGGMGGMIGGTTIDRPSYRAMTIDGQPSSSPREYPVREGERVRFRFINASSATAATVQLAGHPMTVTHADGRPIDPVNVDSFGFASGERYDAVVEANQVGSWELLATPINGSEPPARAVVAYENASDSSPRGPTEPNSRLSYSDLHARSSIEGIDGRPDVSFDLTLSAGSDDTWLIDGQAYPNADPLLISEGDHVRIHMANRSPVIHPMHLHGHFFQVGDAVKDTVVVPGHMGDVTIDFVADNPGDWFFHCHNLYHLEAGMARVIRYVE